jgi:hypothetical protein
MLYTDDEKDIARQCHKHTIPSLDQIRASLAHKTHVERYGALNAYTFEQSHQKQWFMRYALFCLMDVDAPPEALALSP